MWITIIVPNNKSGLEKDRIVIAKLLKENGCQLDFRDPFTRYIPLSEYSELSIFLEFYDKKYMGKKNILIPNQEWFFIHWLADIKRFDAIFCKTHYSFNIFKKYHRNVMYTGFTSLDFYDETINKNLICFHASGKSRAKGTEVVINAWQTSGLPTLHLVSNIFIPNIKKNSPLHHHHFLEEKKYKKMMNECLIHIIPSQVEGFGHCQNESMSCAAIIITTDYPPMNELSKKFLIPPVSIYKIPDRLGEVVYIQPIDIVRVLNKVLGRKDLLLMGQKNRLSYLKNDKLFKERFVYHIKRV